MSKVHFLNVGHGDCTVIEHDSGRLSVIDINNGMDLDPASFQELRGQFQVPLFSPSPFGQYSLSRVNLLEKAGYQVPLTNPVDFLKGLYPGKPVFRYVQSHPDLDHMRGLSALRASGIGIINFWDTNHGKIPESLSEQDAIEWAEYQRLRCGQCEAKVLPLYRGANAAYFSEDPPGIPGGDGIEILAPTPETEQAANSSGNTNNLSYVLRVTLGGVVVILGGDAEQEVWESVLRAYGNNLKCHVLKASHHGRDTGYHQEAVEAMSPAYTIVSVGRKPDTDASNKYLQYSGEVWSTRWKGNISIEIDSLGRGTIKSEYGR